MSYGPGLDDNAFIEVVSANEHHFRAAEPSHDFSLSDNLAHDLVEKFCLPRTMQRGPARRLAHKVLPLFCHKHEANML